MFRERWDGGLKTYEGALGGDRHLDDGDDFIGVCICHNLSRIILFIRVQLITIFHVYSKVIQLYI